MQREEERNQFRPLAVCHRLINAISRRPSPSYAPSPPSDETGEKQGPIPVNKIRIKSRKRAPNSFAKMEIFRSELPLVREDGAFNDESRSACLEKTEEKQSPMLIQSRITSPDRAQNPTSWLGRMEKSKPEISMVRRIGSFGSESQPLVQYRDVSPERDRNRAAQEAVGSSDISGRPKWSAEEKGKMKEEKEEEEGIDIGDDELKASIDEIIRPLSFGLNIDERSEAFIRSRLESMRVE